MSLTPAALRDVPNTIQRELSEARRDFELVFRGASALWAGERTRRLITYLAVFARVCAITVWSFHKINLPSGPAPSVAPRWGVSSFTDFLTLRGG